MKLKSLMPLGIVAGLATTVTPLITSCGTKGWQEEFLWNTQQSKPELEPKAEQQWFPDWVECMESYLNDVSNNHSLLAYDIMYSNWYQDGIDDEIHYYAPTVPITQKDITSMSVTLNNINVASHKLSFINEFTWKPVASNTDDETTEKYVVSNMEYVIRRRPDQHFDPYQYIDIIAPKLWMDTLLLLQEEYRGPEVVAQLQAIVNDDIENLSNDGSWYVEVPSTEQINGELQMQRIDCKNIKDIGPFAFWWMILPLTIATTYYSNTEIY